MSDDETTRIMTRRRKEQNDVEKDTQTASADVESKKSDNTDPISEDGGDEERTRLFSPSRRSKNSELGQTDGSSVKDDPVVGWLVIVDGPGKGNYVHLGFGMNGIGRNETNRIQLDFGDDEISRENHALLTYDPKSQKYFIQHGGGKNLTYLRDEPVLQPKELSDRDTILVGETKLMFVALCSEDFQW